MLFFYPKDDTPGCTIECKEFRDARADFQAKAHVFGISPDDMASHQAFRDKYALNFPLLSDPEHQVASLFGVWGPKKNGTEGIHRTTFVIRERKDRACIQRRETRRARDASAGGALRIVTESLNLQPIGVVHSPFKERVDAPRQPILARGVQGTIELFSGRNLEQALEDIQGFNFIWVLFWFHLNTTWKPKVSPPRSGLRRGVFATRSPYRPNPIGMSVVELCKVDGLILSVQNLDILDGSPVLDLKPYIAYTDSVPDASSGWLEAPSDPQPDYAVEFSAAGAGAAELPELRLCAGNCRALRGRAAAGTGTAGLSPHSQRRRGLRDRRQRLARALRSERANDHRAGISDRTPPTSARNRRRSRAGCASRFRHTLRPRLSIEERTKLNASRAAPSMPLGSVPPLAARYRPPCSNGAPERYPTRAGAPPRPRQR